MSLLSEAMELYATINIVTKSDGIGGYETVESRGKIFKGAMVFNNSTQSKIAQKMGVSSVYTLTTSKKITLMYHDVIERVRDKKRFRITSDGDDVFTPNSSNLDMKQVSCEEFMKEDIEND